jgi:hypothetical protein
MVRRIKRQLQFSYRPGTLRIEGKIPLTHGGAVGTVSVPGVKSVTKVSDGLYTVNFDEKYLALVGWGAQLQSPLTWDGTPTIGTDGYGIQLVSDEFVDGDEGAHSVVNGGDGYAQLQAIQPDGGGAAVLTNGMAIWFSFDLKTRSVG